jgi:hypothetical protein
VFSFLGRMDCRVVRVATLLFPYHNDVAGLGVAIPQSILPCPSVCLLLKVDPAIRMQGDTAIEIHRPSV